MRILFLPLCAILVGCDVTEPSPVTVTFCQGQVVGGTIAIRDDGGAFGVPGGWTTVEAADGQTFSFAAPRRLTIAFTESETPNASNLRMFQLTADELSRLNCLPNGPLGNRTYTGTIAGLGTGRIAQVGLGTAVISRGNGSFTLQNSAAGASDLVALMRAGTTVEKFIVRRELDLLSGSVISPIDFASAEAAAARFNTTTVSGAGTASLSTIYRIIGTGTSIGVPVPQVNGLMTLASLPAEMQAATDFYVFGASLSSRSATSEGRTIAIRFTMPADRLLALGPPLEAPSTSFTAPVGPSSIAFTLPVQSEYSDRADVTVSQVTEGMFLGVAMTMTRAYRGASSAWRFQTPDPTLFTARSVRLDPNVSTLWVVRASSGDFESLFLDSPDAELTVREAYVDGAVGAGVIYHSPINNSHPERLCRVCSRKLPF